MKVDEDDLVVIKIEPLFHRANLQTSKSHVRFIDGHGFFLFQTQYVKNIKRKSIASQQMDSCGTRWIRGDLPPKQLRIRMRAVQPDALR